ncbi:pyrimidine 5'-nucleotidase-like protein [Aureococcus anophagefferens]|nr:pyrimidine 5'-nucleotidase-like protein [Aureococcus anophagefferens]
MVALRLGFLTMQALVRRRRRGVARSVFGDARAEYFNGGEASIAAVLGPASARGLQVIFDFDRTLTASNSSQCHDGLRRVGDAAPRRSSPTGASATRAGRRRSAGGPCGAAAAALRELRRLGVPTLVVSAGLEHVILGALARAGFDDAAPALDGGGHEGIKVLANRLITDDDGVVVGAFPEEPVHSGNKRDAHGRLPAYFAATGAADARRLLVLGDSVGDAAVGAAVPKACGAAVGFFDPASPWGTRASFEAAYDVLFPADGGLGWLAETLAAKAS